MNDTKFEVSADGKTVTVTFPTSPDAPLVMGTKQVDELLRALGVVRANMLPKHPRSWTLRQTTHVIPDPEWATEPDALAGDTVLHIRDRRFGWLHYMIPREKARKLAGLLLSQVTTPPPGSEQLPN